MSSKYIEIGEEIIIWKDRVSEAYTLSLLLAADRPSVGDGVGRFIAIY
jgi:hypothetical protein